MSWGIQRGEGRGGGIALDWSGRALRGQLPCLGRARAAGAGSGVNQQELSRRAVLAGFCSALALAFAPLDRFMAELRRMIEAIFGAPRRYVMGIDYGRKSYGVVYVTMNGQLLSEEQEIRFSDIFGRTWEGTAVVPMGGKVLARQV